MEEGPAPCLGNLSRKTGKRCETGIELVKILLIGNYLPDKQESMLRFADLLVESLRPYPHEVKLIRPDVVFNRSQASYEEKAKWWGYLDKFLIFPFQLKRAARWADVVHICDHSNAFYIHFVKNQPHLINCHDVIAIRAALDDSNPTTKRSGKILQNMILRGLKKAQLFACISNNTREELLDVTGISPQKAKVIYMGINYPFDPLQDKQWLKHKKLSSDFVLHVGGNQPYKNRMGVLRIYQQLHLLQSLPPLVLAGKPWTEEMRNYVTDNDLQESVVEVANPSNEELCALYSSARAFVFPSLAEGFGWPVIEAQACGCPVLTSNFAPLTEIGGDAAFYCDPRDEKGAAHALQTLLHESENDRKARIESGLRNVGRFTPQTMIEGYMALYQEAMETQN